MRVHEALASAQQFGGGERGTKVHMSPVSR
jgi:hypothetical protein